MKSLLLLLLTLPLFAQTTYELVSFADSGTNVTFEVFTSTDLTNWTSQSPTYDCLTPPPGTNGPRDPSIMTYSGLYYLIHTNSCSSPNSYVIAWSHSTDGINWAPHATLDLTTMGIPNAVFAWAPEWFIDPNGSGLASVHVFLTISTNGGGNFQVFEIHPTAADFSTWSNVQAVTVTGVSTLIDVFPVYLSGTYYLWYKLQDGSCNIQYASSATLLGTYTNVKTGNWAGLVSQGCVEGPALVRTGTSSWRLFLDLDFDSISGGQLFYSVSTDNWATWTTPILTTNTATQAKQGTVIPLGVANPLGSITGNAKLTGNAVLK